MVSSKFAHRRRTRGTPLICISAPKPPPVIPIPPPAWPPYFFDLWFQYTFPWMMGPETKEWEHTIPATDWPRIWRGEFTNGEEETVEFNLDEETGLGTLGISGTCMELGPYYALKADFYINTGIETNYEIDEWDELSPPITYAKAKFTF